MSHKQDPPTVGVECRECHTSFYILYKDFEWSVEQVKENIVDCLYVHLIGRHPNSNTVKGLTAEQTKKKVYKWLVDFPPPFPHTTPYVSPAQTPTAQTPQVP